MKGLKQTIVAIRAAKDAVPDKGDVDQGIPKSDQIIRAFIPLSKGIVTMSRASICTLDQALDFYDDNIIERFLGLYNTTPEETQQLFHETKKWVWLLASAAEDRRKGIYVPRLVIDDFLIFIDEMWHNFILFTKQYHDYCFTKFGFFVHHNPTSMRVKDEMRVKLRSPEFPSEILNTRREQYSYIYDKLGAETLALWYENLCDKYTRSYFNEIRR